MSEVLEVKKLIEQIGAGFEEYKKTNDERLEKAAKGESVAEIEHKLAKIDEDLDKWLEAKATIEAFMAKMTAPGAGEAGEKGASLAEEVKNFNLALRADFQQKGRGTPQEFDVEGYKQYKSGFFKMAAGVKFEHLESGEQKAMSAGSDPDGGYMLPHSTQGRVLAILQDQSIMRQLAEVQVISTNDIEGLIDNDEVDAGWVSELGSRTNTDTPKLGKWRIEAHEMYAQPKASQKLLDDAAVDIEAWLAQKVAAKFGRLEGAAYWTGDGVGKPHGLAAYPTDAAADDTRPWGKFQHVLSGANGDFHTTKLDPIQDLQGYLKEHFLANAQFVMRREVRTKLRKLKEATNDRYLWEPSNQVGQPDRLNGYPVRIDQYMPKLESGSLSLAFGDFRQAYLIVDRLGIRTLRDPYTAKPYVAFYSTKRTGGGAQNFEAIKFLKFASS